MRLLKKLTLAFCISAAILAPTISLAQSVKIVAVVNDDIISTSDIQKRVNLFLLTTQIPLNPQTKEMIFERVLNNTIDEKVKLSAAEKEGIKISPQELDAAVKVFEKNNKIPAGKLKSTLTEAHVGMETFEQQLKADMAWNRLVHRKAASELNLTQKELETAMQEAQKDLSTPKFYVSEIFIKKNKAKDIHLLVENLRKDPRFELYAMQFSQSPTAANGGNLGWLNKGKLPPIIEKKLNKMKEGDVSDPIAYNDGYYIIKLDKTFDPKTDKPEIPTESEMKRFLENQRTEAFAKKYLQELRQKAVIELRN